MELTCSRCHQTVETEACYCPVCGLPQLVYSPEGPAVEGQPAQWGDAVRDAGSVDWKPALRLALALAIPTGVFCSISGPLGLLLMAATGAWAVSLYMRGQRPAWLTIGAGARIGLVTGMVGAWTAAAATGVSLYATRFWLHKAEAFDELWLSQLNKTCEWLVSHGFDVQQVAAQKAFLLTPEGRAGDMVLNIVMLALGVLAFATAGGALGARFLARPRRTGN